jgi:hypothetical protein
MALSGAFIWFLGIFLVALVVSVSAVLLKKRARLSRVKTGDEIPSTGLISNLSGIGKWGFICSGIALIIAIYSLPVAKYLPEDLGMPIFIYSLLAFPIFGALGLILSVIGYLSNRHRVNLIAGAAGGLAFVWVVASMFIISMTGCAAATIEVSGEVQSVNSSSVVVNEQTVAISDALLPLPAGVTPGAQVHLWAYRTGNGSLIACGVGVEDASETPE